MMRIIITNLLGKLDSLIRVVVICLSCSILSYPAAATTVTATATGRLPYTESDSADTTTSTSRTHASDREFYPVEADERDRSSWTFDLTSDPNFSSLVQHSRPLKSALLKLTVSPERFQISPDALGLQTLTETSAQKAIQLSVQVEVDLLELYEPDELLDMLASNSAKLNIPYPDPETISSAQIQLTAETSGPFIPTSLLVFASILALMLIGSSVWWRKKWRRARIAAQTETLQGEKLSENEARMALVGNMASSIVHDVKNAFTAIRSCAEVIGDDALNPHDRKDFAQLIVNEIDRGVGMTQELLDFTSGKHRALNLQPSDISGLLEEMTTFVRQDLHIRQIALHTDFHETGIPLLVDAEKMRRVFLNIITNARDAMPDGGNLTIASYIKDEQICIDFSDTGCGMSPELQAHIFEPMVTQGKAHGTGLGMAIVKDILDAHQAKIYVQSEVGKGTMIRIMFPLDEESHPQHTETPSPDIQTE